MKRFISRVFEVRSNQHLRTFQIDNVMLYNYHFKDRTVFSLNSTGTFSDGIIRAVSRLRSFYTHIIPVKYSFPRMSNLRELDYRR